MGFVLTFIPWDGLFWINPFQYVLAERTIVNQNDSIWYQGIPASILFMIGCLIISMQTIKSSRI
ncbi:hypothetical protein [Ornithinibacillus halophilus]|uniref:hypothetical protein n=1 Tax=Ornithinibacillus halophilus TaxID=930117 RepID=UPI000933A043|nr:hypothetical protein [Ornithinibacillus halophilus]